MVAQESFNRVEKKYVLTKNQFEGLMERIGEHIKEDEYFFSKICNVYYDASDFGLIRHSIEKPVYKEKLRLRSYNVPNKDTNVFIEIKKKYDGIVYKRRITLPLAEAENYLDNDVRPTTPVNEQILREIDYFKQSHQVEGKMFIAYDRSAYVSSEDSSLRITFDANLRARESEISLENGDDGRYFFENDERVMEIKSIGAYPRWMVDALNELEIYPASFSKYGSFYKEKVTTENPVYDRLKERVSKKSNVKGFKHSRVNLWKAHTVSA